MREDSGGLAIGELLGAAAFVTSCVVGSMCIIKPFKVDRAPFIRDVGFFTVAVVLLMVVLWDSKIELWEAEMLIVLYFVYVVIVVAGSWWERRRARRLQREDLMRDEFREEVIPEIAVITEPYRDEREYSLCYKSEQIFTLHRSLSRLPPRTRYHHKRPSDISTRSSTPPRFRPSHSSQYTRLLSSFSLLTHTKCPQSHAILLTHRCTRIPACRLFLARTSGRLTTRLVRQSTHTLSWRPLR